MPTTFNKLLAVKEGGGNPGAPGSADSLNLAFADFDAAITSFDLTANSNLLVAFDAASLDFGNAAANPAFNFLGTGAFAVAGDARFSATGGNTGTPDFQVDGYAKFLDAVELQGNLGVGGNLTVSGTSNLTGNVSMAADASITSNLTVSGTSAFTGNVSMTNDLLVSGNGTVNGNLTVMGTLVTKEVSNFLVSDNYGDMNWNLTATSPQDAGFTFNYSPIANAAITAFSTVNGAKTITLSAPIAGLTVGGIIVVAGLDSGLEQNEGLYEVGGFNNNGSDILISASPAQTFLKATFTDSQAPGANSMAAWVRLGVLRTSDSGALQWAKGSLASLTYGNVPFNGYSGSQAWTGSFSVQSGANEAFPFAIYDDTGNVGLLKIDTAIAAVATKYDLFIDNAGVGSKSLILGEVSADPGVGAGVGKVYTKSMPTNNVAIDELFYVSTISGVPTPVQITKDGELNIGAISFSLQQAYDDGSAILTGANGAVSITDGTNNASNALAVTGKVDIVGALDVSNAVSLDSTLDVTGVSTLSGNVFMQAAASVGSTLGVSGAATFSSTITGLGDLSILSGANAPATFTVAAASGNVWAAGNADFDGTFNADGAATLGSTLGVTGAATLSSTLDVVGAASMYTIDADGNVHFTATGGGATVNNMTPNLWVEGYSQFAEVWATGALGVGGAATLNSTLAVIGAATLSSSLDVTGAATLSSTLAVTGAATFSSSITGSGNLALKDGQSVDTFTVAAASGDVWAAGTLDVDGAATLVSTLDVNGAVLLLSTLNVTDAATLNGAVVVDNTLTATGAVDFDSTLNVDGAVTFASTLGVSGLSTLDSLAVTNNASVGGTFGATGAVTFASTLGVSGLSTLDSLAVTNNASVGGTFGATGAATLSNTLAVTGAATLSSTLAVTGNITASADVSVAGILDLNGSVDADVTAFDVLSSGDVSIKATGILSLKGPAVAANLNEQAAGAIVSGELVMMTANGLAPAQANAQNVIALGAALAGMSTNDYSEGKIAEFGSVEVNADGAIAKGDRLYLSAATAGAVTSTEPSAAGSSVFQVGVALAAAANGKVKIALRPQFMYNVF